jgi:hypothetical protein
MLGKQLRRAAITDHNPPAVGRTVNHGRAA